MTFSQMEDELKLMKATTDENLRNAIEVVCKIKYLTPKQNEAIEQLINAAHALGILKLRQARLREGVGTCSPDVKPSFTSDDKNKQETEAKLK